VDLRVDAYLPGDHVADEKQRMEMYKRIASIRTDSDRAEVIDEMIDRYGDIPAVVETLLDVSQLRAICNRIGISQVARTRGGAALRLDEKYIPDPAMLIQAMAAASPALNFGTGGRPYILYRTNLNSDREMLDALLKTMKKLTEALEALQEAASEEAAKAENRPAGTAEATEKR